MAKRCISTLCLRRKLLSICGGSAHLSASAGLEPSISSAHRPFNNHPSKIATWNITSTSRRFVASDVETVWKQTTQRLLQTPIGDFDLKMWNECHKSILWWLEMSGDESVRQPLLLLDRMYAEADATSTTSPEFFDTDLLNLVVNHWRISVSHDSFDANEDLYPQHIIERVHMFHSTGTNLKPDTQTYAMIIAGASSFKNMGDRDGILVAEQLLDWLMTNCSQHPRLRPNVYTFSSLMDGWVKSGRLEAADKVQALLDDMKLLNVENQDWDIAPNTVTYSIAIDTWAKIGKVDRVEDLLYEMREKYRNGDKDLKINIRTFNGYLVALAKAGQIDGAESVLEQMHDLYDSGELEEPPSVISYSTVLDACAKSNYRDAGERAEYILRKMLDNGIDPNTISYNSVINACVKNDDMERAESILSEMHEASLNGNTDIKPSAHTYTAVLSGLSKTQSPQAGERGEKILDWMNRLARSGELDRAPNVISYNSVLDCWAKSSSRDAPEKAKQFLQQMVDGNVKPDTYSFNTVIAALTRAGRIQEAESMLGSMSQSGVNPDVITYNTVLSAWTKSGSADAQERVDCLFSLMKDDERVELDLITYNIILHFYSMGGNPDRCQAILDDMNKESSTVQADTVSFNTVISAWSRSGREDAPGHAESILSSMLSDSSKVLPNTVTFNAVMGVWLKSRLPEAAERCERILGIMNDMARDGNHSVKPDAISYNTLIRACEYHPSDEAPDLAESAFHEMTRRYEAGERWLKPTTKTYGCLIHVWSKSSRSEAGEQSEKHLRELVRQSDLGELKEKPRIFEFIATIQAWRNSGDQKAIYKADGVMYLLLTKFRQTGDKVFRPNARLFESILELLASSHLKDKPKHADRIVDLMKEHGVKPGVATVRNLKRCYSERIQEMGHVGKITNTSR
jgi:pentatricopeptide repeat protein